jgi:CSLREA domain-containing protein
MARAAQTVINFDDVADGTVINTHYAGLTFTNPVGGNIYARTGSGFAPSSPNVVSINASGTAPFNAFVSAVDVHFATRMRVVSIDARPVGPIEFLTPLTKRPFLEAFDSANNFLGEVLYQGPLPTNCCGDVGPAETLTYTSSTTNIAWVRFSVQNPGTNNPAVYGLFDNLRYDDGFYTLNVNIVGGGTVLTTPIGPYYYNSTVSLTAGPFQDWAFSNWSGSISSTQSQIVFAMDTNKFLTATFVKTAQLGPNFVVTTTDDHDDGTAGITDCTLREAVNAANANADTSTITFAPNVTDAITLTLGQLTINQNTIIKGPGAGVLAINGNNSGHAFNVLGGTVLISDLTITNCHNTGAAGSAGASNGGTGGTGGNALGGAIYTQTALTLSNCWVTGNTAQGGAGGVGGADDVNNPAGTGGHGGAGYGGGIYNFGLNPLTLVNCTLSGNSAIGGNGGDGSPAFDNYPTDAGGSGGPASDGLGGVIYGSTTLNLTNCTFSGNTASGGNGGLGQDGYADGPGGSGGAGGGGYAGAINNQATVHMAACTISLNTAAAGAGGAAGTGRTGNGVNGTPGTALGGGLLFSGGAIQNSIVAGNTSPTGPDAYGTVSSLGYNLVGNAGGVTGFTGTGDQVGTSGTPINPRLGPLQNNGGPTPTIAPSPISPAVDKGNRGPLTSDQRGQPRPYDFVAIPNAAGGDGSDIGAVELTPPVLAIVSAGANVVISWPTPNPGWTLQSGAQLGSGAAWTTVQTSPLIIGNLFKVTLNKAVAKQFYRLIGIGSTNISGLFNTGVGANGALLASGSVDPHWQIVQSPDVSFPGPNAIVVNDTGFPIPPWLANGPASKWLAPQASQATGNQSGDYKYRISFNLTGLDRFNTVINGHWTSDNVGTQVLLNGVATGFVNDGNFGVVGSPFTITSGFVAGVNTLDFVVNNAGTGANPTGVRIELSGTANFVAP